MSAKPSERKSDFWRRKSKLLDYNFFHRRKTAPFWHKSKKVYDSF